MRWSTQLIPTIREVPSEAIAQSHRLMLRAGLIRQLSNGLYAWLPLGLRALRRVESIVREELDAAGCLEIKPSVVQPGDLWKESGRWDAFGDSMLKAKNRLGDDLVISPTAEEAFVFIVRGELTSWRRLPLTLYQINTKYRDEIRPRYGVMRAREFTMMDAYSFNADGESLDKSYRELSGAYHRIFERCGLTTIAVHADSGAMGGAASQEFMVESPIGDDTLLLCDCGYAANAEKATTRLAASAKTMASGTPKPVSTPGVRTIAELEAFLHDDATSFIKTLIYRTFDAAAGSESFHAVCIRGDLDVNEAKLASVLGAGELSLASNEDVVRLTGAPVGFAGPVGLSRLPLVCDESVMLMHDAVVGGLALDLHLTGVEPGRDFMPSFVVDLRSAHSGDPCPNCGEPMRERKGNELGHVFKLGDKYTKAMSVSFLAEDGTTKVPLMGCYGIGIDRTLASVIEEHHDADGIAWPMNIAPVRVVIIPVIYSGELKTTADSLYDALRALHVDVLLDDREDRAGVKFKDADLVGIPIKIVVGDRSLPDVEIKRRGKKECVLVPQEEAAAFVLSMVRTELGR